MEPRKSKAYFCNPAFSHFKDTFQIDCHFGNLAKSSYHSFWKKELAFHRENLVGPSGTLKHFLLSCILAFYIPIFNDFRL